MQAGSLNQLDALQLTLLGLLPILLLPRLLPILLLPGLLVAWLAILGCTRLTCARPESGPVCPDANS